MEASTPRDFFEKILPKRFKADKAAGIDVTIQLRISGPNSGDWIATVKKQTLVIEEGISLSPTLSLEMEEKDFIDLINGKLSAEKAFFTGKIKFKGNIALALKLRETGFL